MRRFGRAEAISAGRRWNLDPVANSHGLNGAALGAKPALARQPRGQRSLQRLRAALRQKSGPAIGHWIKRRSQLNNRLVGRFRRQIVKGGLRRGSLQLEPEERIGRKRERIRGLSDRRERHITNHLDGLHSGERGEIERDRLSEAAEVRHAQYRLARPIADIEVANVGEDPAVGWIEKHERAAAENLKE